jgi:hypothetical protein
LPPSALVDSAPLLPQGEIASAGAAAGFAARDAVAARVPSVRTGAEFERLAGAVRDLGSADAESRDGVLNRLFAGARDFLGSAGPAPVNVPMLTSSTPVRPRPLPAAAVRAANADPLVRAEPPVRVALVSNGLNWGARLLARLSDAEVAAMVERFKASWGRFWEEALLLGRPLFSLAPRPAYARAAA